MIQSSSIWKFLKGRGFRFFSGVPCSILKEMIAAAEEDPEIRYIPAVKESAAIGIASGAYLAGEPSGILMQNSGLGNVINALTSFNLIYKVPVLMFISWRGFEGNDAPEHLIMGEKMIDMLETLGIPHVTLSEEYEDELKWAIGRMKEKSIPVAVIIKKGVVK